MVTITIFRIKKSILNKTAEDYADYADTFPVKKTIAKHKHDQALELEYDATKVLMNKKWNEEVILELMEICLL